MNNGFMIATDTASDLSYSSQYPSYSIDIRLIPIHYKFEKTQPIDPDNLDNFYQTLNPENLSRTAAVNPSDFITFFEPILEAGKDILYCGLSSTISSTYQNSLLAREELLQHYPERHIICIDSLCAASGISILITNAIKMQREGKNLDAIAAYIEKTKMNISHDFIVSSFTYLHANGRVNKAVAFIGHALGCCPIMYFSNDGQIEKSKIARSTLSALKALANKVVSNVNDPDNGTVIIAHGNVPDQAKKLADLIREHLPKVTIELGRMGHVIGGHTGPSVIGVFYEGRYRHIAA